MSELTSLWPHWQRPFWLLLIPLLGFLLWQLWHREKRSGRWQALLPAAFQSALLTATGGRNSRLPWLALGLAWLLALLALLGPSWQRIEQQNPKPADPLVVLLELTPEMLASDASPNRLAQAKRKLLDLLEARQDAQTAIVVYAGSAHTLVPLSDDLATSRNLLDALSPEIMPEPGKRADLAVIKALQLLERGAQGNGRLLLLTSSLDVTQRQAITQALGRRGERLRILGIGSTQGAPIIQEDGSFLKDAQGTILLPRLDSNGLKRFASELGGLYQSVTLDERDLRNLGLLDAPQQLRRDGELTQLQAWADQSHWLLLPLLLLAACAARRGWLLCLPLLLLSLPQNSYAFSFDDLWLRADQQGQRLLEAQQPAEAAQRFHDPRWQGQALYQAGDYAAAAERFANGESASDHYNRGNALARSNELEAALDAYTQALELQPDLAQAQKNKALVEELLRQNQQQQQNQTDDPQEPDEQQNQPSSQPQAGQSDPDAQQQAEQSQAEPSEPEDQGEKPAQPSAYKDADTPPKQPEEDDSDSGVEQIASAEPALDGERRQALEQWLRQIPDDPGELLRRKFRLEQQQRQEQLQ
ncbi:TPR domain protein in aerotolerance operon [Pseudomonas sp. 9AZ]|uniref:VWA domain-containing protein n=1 Tax=Pseudomonas sp. 9AZ TaxID=2653168 RepID=UPI0012F2F133|nr:VWA domain-containing protein [Pseudomonas sp. 9AZ]VXC89741.1 TPR domain protein in aerotolerance operon [Pseudomonas sp. 9AZ]